MVDSSTEAAVERVGLALRSWYGVFNDLGRQFGVHVGMHHSDASALIQITDAEQRGIRLTQAQLARRIGLTGPATSALVGRLVQAGHVQRRRDVVDGRAVTLRSTPAVHQQIQSFFHAVGEDLDEIAATYPLDALESTATMVEQMTESMRAHLEGMLRRGEASD